jgi:hypothetical protein
LKRVKFTLQLLQRGSQQASIAQNALASPDQRQRLAGTLINQITIHRLIAQGTYTCLQQIAPYFESLPFLRQMRNLGTHICISEQAMIAVKSVIGEVNAEQNKRNAEGIQRATVAGFMALEHINGLWWRCPHITTPQLVHA